jgi:hypothetical protein
MVGSLGAKMAAEKAGLKAARWVVEWAALKAVRWGLWKEQSTAAHSVDRSVDSSAGWTVF